jgi:hypothetical protein
MILQRRKLSKKNEEDKTVHSKEKSKSKEKMKKKAAKVEKEVPEFEQPEMQENVDTSILCSVHQKPIEAFCQTCGVLVCIDCILSNEHKGHILISIEEAIDQHIDLIGKETTKSKDIREKIQAQENEITEKCELMITSCLNRKEDI